MGCISRVFDKVLELEPGQTIVLNFNSMGDMKSKRTLLFREKAKYESRVKNPKDIFIRQEMITRENVFRIYLSVDGGGEDWTSNAVVMDDKQVTPLIERRP